MIDENKTTYVQMPGVYSLSTDLRTAFPRKSDPVLYGVLALVGELSEVATLIAAGGSPTRKDVIAELGDVLLSYEQVADATQDYMLSTSPSEYPTKLAERAPGVLVHDALRAAGLLAEMVKKSIEAGKSGSDAMTTRYNGKSFTDYLRAVGEPVAALFDAAGPSAVLSAARNKLESRVTMAGIRPSNDNDGGSYRY